ncbi:hypothetical protein VFPPC_15676 [Pochonia chlamydosporia 170]|uniref:Uncharacterized protein n=1 Tax=Pochonia chlamydosporia 170 TaxID=1380566 RepID=A0A179G1F8_METCM|nr:hypothetical protein VFPPC_15676 [Pochonia chlamydosporia 170]OAQ71280.2 hypothetical protein VFPPC_15676 [Pochonia chlamydosporia 170]
MHICNTTSTYYDIVPRGCLPGNRHGQSHHSFRGSNADSSDREVVTIRRRRKGLSQICTGPSPASIITPLGGFRAFLNNVLGSADSTVARKGDRALRNFQGSNPAQVPFCATTHRQRHFGCKCNSTFQNR